jgi:hypothetical protein
MSKSNVRHLGISKPAFDSTAGANGSCVLTYDGSDQLIQIDKTIGEFVYRKTLTWTGGNLTAISAWVKL